MPQQPIGFLLTRLDQLINACFAAAFSQSGVTRRQWQLLNVLDRGAATVGQLDAAVAPFLSSGDRNEEHLEPLIERDWVVHAGDRYELTETGRDALAVLQSRVQDIRDTLVLGLGPGEYDRTVRNLSTMISNLTVSGDSCQGADTGRRSTV